MTRRAKDIPNRVGINAWGPKKLIIRLIRKGTPPAPREEAMANIAESTEVRSCRSFAMVMVIAYAGPTPSAMPLIANSRAGSWGYMVAGKQLSAATEAPPMIIADGFKRKHLQRHGASTRRFTSALKDASNHLTTAQVAAKSAQKTMLHRDGR